MGLPPPPPHFYKKMWILYDFFQKFEPPYKGGGEITILRLNVFDQHVKNLKREMKISERLLLIRKTTTDYLLGYSDLKKRHFKLTTRDLSEQKELRADAKAIQ